jgi:hypothetical protein
MSEWSWTDGEELLIATIEENESVPRAEAIRRMQRRKDAARRKQARERLCQNQRCTKGARGGPNSLAHLRVDARYCDATCKKAVQRGPNRQKQSKSS